jgi:phosphoglycerate dehydrogenase-like enzyme
MTRPQRTGSPPPRPATADVMSRPVVILHTDNPDPARAVVACAHQDLAIHLCDSYEGLVPLVEKTGAEVVYSIRFAGTPKYPRAGLLACPSLRWLSIGGSGTDHIQPWDPQRLTVTNAAGVAADMMAEYAIGAMLSFALGWRTFARAQFAHRWTIGKVEPIAGRTLLILGLGRTAQAVARRAKTLGLTVIGVRARPASTPNVDEVHGIDALPSLWCRADYVLCCVPLLASTRGLVNADAFGAMKPNAVLIDVSRGGVVEEAALLDALHSGAIKGAALDVFTVEPLPADHPLWDLENVIVTPHCSSVYAGWDVKSVEMFSENLARYRRGEPLENVVDPVRGY